MFNLKLEWDRPNKLSSQSPEHLLRVLLTPQPTNNGQKLASTTPKKPSAFVNLQVDNLITLGNLTKIRGY